MRFAQTYSPTAACKCDQYGYLQTHWMLAHAIEVHTCEFVVREKSSSASAICNYQWWMILSRSTPPPSTNGAQKHFLHPYYTAPGSQAADDIAIPKKFFITTYTRVACNFLLPWWIHFAYYGWWGYVAEINLQKVATPLLLQASLHAVRKIKADNLYKTSKLKDHEKWRTQAHHQVDFRAPKFNSVPFQFNPPSCRESLLQFNRFHMPMEAGPTIVCWLILSPMDHSFMPKWTWKSYQSDFKASWFHPGSS